MHVIEVSAFGGPEVLRVKHVPAPVAEPGQVVVDVTAVGVLSFDLVLRAGGGGKRFPVRPPYVPGLGVAGRVLAEGHPWAGRRVLAEPAGGGYAERVLAEPENLIHIPDSVHDHEAMALLHDGSTALALFEAAEVRSGETVLVQPGTGGLGSLLLQLAAAAGARVAAVAHGDLKTSLARDLGAEIVLTADDIGSLGPVDVTFDGIGGAAGEAAFATTTGRFLSYGTASGTTPRLTGRGAATVLTLDMLPDLESARARRVERMLKETADGRIVPLIGQTFPLTHAAEAHEAMENRRTVGKTLLLT